MNFNLGEWIVEALKIIESSKHLKVMVYGLVFSVVLHAVASLLSAL
ncbi:hypothetical protein [Paracandidimonas soli]|uniref:Uncharacterized protein n=1 Tax=Paracandidimonas soli TaxID=1917182 RepID=A0A4V2VPQ5_9BURK|nr:hypothetical protein [Paracandidimonas soli]TCU91629.1 hypothetical protein EV686_11725 [Paracandidimonas soli]